MLSPCICKTESIQAKSLSDQSEKNWHGATHYYEYLCWYAGNKRCGTFTAAAFTGLMPLTSMALSTLLRELADALQWFGGGCVIVGMVLIGRQTVKETNQNGQCRA